MEIRKRHVYFLLGLTFLGMLSVAITWEFVLEDMVVPVFYPGYEIEPLFERWEYVVTSLSFGAVALIMPGWLALRGVTQSERGMGLGSMKERVELVGGSFAIQTGRESGTLVQTSYTLREASCA